MKHRMYNALRFYGPLTHVDELLNHVNSGAPEESDPTIRLIFDFNTIIPVPGDLEEDLYGWRLCNWGTESNALATAHNETALGFSTYRHPADLVIRRLSEMFPTLTIFHGYTNFWGLVSYCYYKNGSLLRDVHSDSGKDNFYDILFMVHPEQMDEYVFVDGTWYSEGGGEFYLIDGRLVHEDKLDWGTADSQITFRERSFSRVELDELRIDFCDIRKSHLVSGRSAGNNWMNCGSVYATYAYLQQVIDNQ